jgi:shikimate dehydrogenase
MRTGLLGHPIDHSLSPAIHNAAYKALGLDWEYALYPCADRESFLQAIAKAQADAATFVGFNVTTPYKVDAWDACATHSPSCVAAGNANVLSFVAEAPSSGIFLQGDNTDGRGLVASLERDADIAIARSSVVLCGMGPVALSALMSLIERLPASISIVSRDPKRACAKLEDFYQRRGQAYGPVELLPLPKIQVIGYETVADSLAVADILIDATPVGMGANDETVIPPEALKPSLAVLDVVYGHGETALLKAARHVGAKAFDGLGMLIEQAALTIEIWARAQGTAVTAPREIMRQAALSG